MEKQQDVFLNGKAQIIEMFQIMEHDEKMNLLKLIRQRNPTLADEILRQSITIDHLSELNEDTIMAVAQKVTAPIMGMALKTTNEDTQKRILSSLPRTYAEEAFEIMRSPIKNERNYVARAKEKVKDVLLSLNFRS